MDSKIHLEQTLRKSGYSVTSQRLTVFKELQRKHDPITIVELSNRVQNVDKASVYRIVELFVRIGLVHRVWSGFKSKIELSEAFSPHHHHFTCSNCGEMRGIHNDQLESAIKLVAKEQGLKLTYHSIELGGYCKKCAHKQPRE